MRPADFIDILIVSYTFFKCIKLVRETRAQQLVKGIVLLLMLLLVCSWLKLNTMTFILRNTVQVGAIALVIIFQPELRRALEKVGRSNIGTIFASNTEDLDNLVSKVSDAVEFMSSQRIGALIVFERSTKLGDIVKTGTIVEAEISSELLINIFIPNTPLHDGAVIMRNGKLSAAACLLPLTENASLSRELGTRHRAALGITEVSDAVVVIVSEETGKISFAQDGDMARNLTKESLKQSLYRALSAESQDQPANNFKKWKESIKWTKK